MNNHKFLWVDTETTGLNSKSDKIIELAALYSDGKKVIEFHRYIKYETYPDSFDKAAEVHGLTKEVLQQKGKNQEIVYNEFIKFLDSKVNKFDKSDKLILAGYNVDFDKDFLYSFFKANYNNYLSSYIYSASLDIMKILMLFIANNRLEIPDNFKLETIADKFGIEFNSHSAIEDIKATMKIYENLIKLLDKK